MSMAVEPPRHGYDWSARVRTTAMEALRYSRFVSLMKRLLSLGAFLTIATVLAFFFVTSDMKADEIVQLLRHGVKVTVNSDDPTWPTSAAT